VLDWIVVNVVQMKTKIVFIPNDVIEIAVLPESTPAEPGISAFKVNSLFERSHQLRDVRVIAVKKPVQMIVEDYIGRIPHSKTLRDCTQHLE